VALAPALVVSDIPDPSIEDLYVEGLYVGNVIFSGGYITVQVDGGMQHISKDTALERQETYAPQARAWLDDVMQASLAKRHIAVLPFPDLDPTYLTPPTRKYPRGSVPEDGSDNQHLPRFELIPASLSEAPTLPAGASHLLVPLIVHYYSHNGGWFQGQTYGCAAGARARVLWVLYDERGVLIGWGEHAAGVIDDWIFSPNSVQVDDYLLEVEDRIAKSLKRHLLK
jgi:hypothetical protein